MPEQYPFLHILYHFIIRTSKNNMPGETKNTELLQSIKAKQDLQERRQNHLSSKMDNMDDKLKTKLTEIAELERKHGVIGVSLNAGDSMSTENALDYIAEIIEDSSRLIKDKKNLRRVGRRDLQS